MIYFTNKSKVITKLHSFLTRNKLSPIFIKVVPLHRFYFLFNLNFKCRRNCRITTFNLNIAKTLSIKLPNIASISHRQLLNPHPKKVIVKASINEAGRR